MPYVSPNSVLSPKGRIRNVEVLFDRGPAAGDSSWSAAEVEFDGRPRIGIRWNGSPDHGVGNPQSRGNATWFILPDELTDAVRVALSHVGKSEEDALAAGYAAMAADSDREREAKEWVEGLIGDAIEAR